MAQIWTESFQWDLSGLQYGKRYFEVHKQSYDTTGGRAGGPIFNGYVTAYPIAPAPTGSVFIFFIRFVGVYGDSHLIGPGVNMEAVGFFPNINQHQCHIQGAADGSLKLKRGATVVATSAAGLQQVGTLHGLAGKITISDTVGTCDLYLDGAAIPGLSGLTGLDTRALAAADWNSFRAGYVLTNGLCDLWVADGSNPTGNDPNSIVLDVRVDYLPPGATGYSSGFAGSDGNSVNNYQQVDETTPDGNTTYNEAAAAAIDAYTTTAPPSSIQVLGMTSLAMAKKTDSGVANLKVGLRSGTTNAMTASTALPVTTEIVITKQHGVDPDGNIVWTEAKAALAQVVIERP